MVPENVPTSGFKRKFSNVDRAPKVRESVLLSSWGSFLINLPSISAEIYVMYPSIFPGTDVSCHWLFFEWSCVFLETSINLHLFLSVAILLKAKSSTVVKTEVLFYLFNEFLSATKCSLLFDGELAFNQKQSPELQKWV